MTVSSDSGRLARQVANGEAARREGLGAYGAPCGEVLARALARYADQSEVDYERLLEAAEGGEIAVGRAS